MSEKSKNLWGDLGDLSEIRTPSEILQEQGEILASMTDGALELIVERTQNNTVFRYDAYVALAQAQKQTRTRILRLTHDLKFYPAVLFDDEGSTAHRGENQEDFKDKLGQILSSEETMTAIGSLMAQQRLCSQDKLV